MSEASIGNVRKFEAEMSKQPQYDLEILHTIHGGVYTRTIMMPPGCMLTGALIKIATTLIISGHVTVYTDGEDIDFVGYNVVPASANRKQAIYAHEHTDMTMLFSTKATTVGEAQEEFTDEVYLLVSSKDHVVVTGE